MRAQEVYAYRGNFTRNAYTSPRVALCIPHDQVLDKTDFLRRVEWVSKHGWHEEVLLKDGTFVLLFDLRYVNPINDREVDTLNALFHQRDVLSPFLRVMPITAEYVDNFGDSFDKTPWFKLTNEFDGLTDVKDETVRRAVIKHMMMHNTRSHLPVAHARSWNGSSLWCMLPDEVGRAICWLLPRGIDMVRRDLGIPCRYVEDKWTDEPLVPPARAPFAFVFGAPASTTPMKYYRKPTTRLPIDTLHSGVIAPWFSVVIAAADDTVVSVHFLA